MIRKSMFLGLTLVLVVALVYLVIRGRQAEKEQAGKPVEIIQKSKSTPTRELGPPDLEIVDSGIRLQEGGKEGDQARTAHHQIAIRNNGHSAYGEIQLRFSYLDRGGKVLVARTHSITQGIQAGETLRVADIAIGDLPAAAAGSRTEIASADLAPAQGR